MERYDSMCLEALIDSEQAESSPAEVEKNGPNTINGNNYVNFNTVQRRL